MTEDKALEEEYPNQENSPSERRQVRPYKSEEWLKITTLWEMGDTTLAELAEMFDRNVSGLSKRLRKYGIERGSRKEEMERRAQVELEKDMSKNLALRVQRANATKEDHYEWATKMSRLAVQTVARAIKDGQPIASTKPDLQAIKDVMGILDKGQAQRNIALGLDKGDIVDEDAMIEFGIFEMTEGERQGVIEAAEAQLRITADDDVDISESLPESDQDPEEVLRSNMQRLASIMEEEDASQEEYRIPGHDPD